MLSYLYLHSPFRLFLSIFFLDIQLANEVVFDRTGIDAPAPWKDQTSTMSSRVHIHRSPVDGEGVFPYLNNSMGANWMFFGSLGS